MLIEACLGLGEAIVSGQIEPDQYLVEKGKARDHHPPDRATEEGVVSGTFWRHLVARARRRRRKSQAYRHPSARIRRPARQDRASLRIPRGYRVGTGRRRVQDFAGTAHHHPGTRVPRDDHGSECRLAANPSPSDDAARSLGLGTLGRLRPCERGTRGIHDKLMAIQDEADIATLILEKGFMDGVIEHLKALYREDRTKLVHLLERGRDTYRIVRERFESPKRPTIDEACELFIAALQFTGSIPFLILASGIEDEEIRGLAEGLRAETLYPEVERRLVAPAAEDLTRELGFSAPEHAAQVTTWMELREGRLDRDILESRWEEVQRGKRFVFQVLPNGEQVRFVSQTGYLLMRAAHQRQVEIGTRDEIVGQAAWPGVHRGRARVVLTPDAVGQTIEDGEVLISIQSSPALMPLLTRAGAIVTDEGGLACHAAIICRELKVPTLIGTNKATRTIRTGDLVEVDAYAQVVRILERARD